MAKISGQLNEKIFNIPRWLGLNEHPDGDTRLKMGEASQMVNWKITRDGNLKQRPGKEFLAGLCSSYIVVQDEIMAGLGVYSPDDEIVVYTAATAATGRIVLTDKTGTVEKGEWSIPAGQNKNGTMTLDSSSWAVSDGELTFIGTNSEIYTFAEFEAALAELEDGEYLYVFVDGSPYAVRSVCLEYNEGKYILGGYHLTAEPEVPSTAAIKGMWAGYINGTECLLVACNGALWNIYDATNDSYVNPNSFIGQLNTSKGVGFIPFDNKVYILNGYEYYVCDGTTLTRVDGYRPLVAIAIGPVGWDSQTGVTTGEYVNLLNGKRRVWISPDGANKVFQMPETGLKSFDGVIDLSTGNAVATGWSGDTTTGKITFTNAPARAVNSYEVQYSVYTHDDSGYSTLPDYRGQVTKNLYAELYSGTTDTKIFIYGDGTNKTRYSGLDYNGVPRADYFPDQYEVAVGDSNTPITSMIRHYGTLVCYKPFECWNLQHGIIELATDELTPAIYCTPMNKDKGNLAPGQVRLVDNSPVTCSGTELYQWINSSYYTSELSRDERQAHRISDRISRSIKEFDLKKCVMWDDNDHQEFYITQNNVALVWNYAVDAWYRYENFDAVAMCSFHGDMLIGTSTGKVFRMSEEVVGDDGETIHSVWESGAMDFGADYARKYASTLWVGLKPEHGTSVDVCVETDRKNTFFEKIVSSEKAKIQGQPFMVKTKIKAKKFEYYRLILRVDSKQPPVTVTNVDFRVRQTGYAK